MKKLGNIVFIAFIIMVCLTIILYIVGASTVVMIILGVVDIILYIATQYLERKNAILLIESDDDDNEIDPRANI